jgi:hypothetical protein
VARCDTAFLTAGPRDWRKAATYTGRVGFWGKSRDFRGAGTGHDIKTPVVVEGRAPVTLAIAPSDRDRMGLEIVGSRRPYAEVRFVPCRHQARTGWPAGFRRRDRDSHPVVVLVRSGNAPAARLEVGRP